MALDTFEPLVLRVFGGLCTFIDRLSLGLGQSPNCKNVSFFPGTVSSRYGYELFTQYRSAAITASSPIYSFKPFISKLGAKMILYLTSFGATSGTLTSWIHGAGTSSLMTDLGNDAILTLKGDSLFGKLYLAVNDGASGRMRAVATDGTTISEIAPDGPAWAIEIAKPAYRKEITTKAGAGLSLGKHMFTWLFVTKSGYITRPGTGVEYIVTNAAVAVLDVYGAPIGPTDTVARILALTAAGDTNFYYLEKTTIWDNTTRNFSVVVTDAEILNGEPVRPYFTLHTPASPAGVISYADRLILWGCREKSELSTVTYPNYATRGAPNISFDGGFQTAGDEFYSAGPPSYALPGYWQVDASTYVGATFTGFAPGANQKTLVVNGFSTVGNNGYVNQKSFDSSYLRTGQLLGLRVRAKRSAVVGAGAVRVYVDIYNAAGVLQQTIEQYLNSSTLTTNYKTLEVAGTTIAPMGQASVLGVTGYISVYVVHTTAFTPADATSFIEIDFIELVDLNDTSQQNVLRASWAGNAESFDLNTGLISVGPDDGEGLRDCFRLRDALYIAKERSLYVTKDTGDEPYMWPVDLVDRMSGTPSPHGVGYGDGWVVIAARVGLVLFDGSSPQIISQEITPTWNTINWTDPNFIWVVVDPATKQIHVGAKTTAGTTDPCNLLLTLDYTEGFDNPIPSGQGRKWSIDTVMTKVGTTAGYHQGATLVDIYGTPRPVYSMSSTVPTTPADTVVNAITYQNTARNDFPDVTKSGEGNIDAYYETAPIGPDIGRGLFDKVVHRIRGSGTLATYFIRPDGSSATKPDGSTPALAQANLTSAPEHDIELGGNQQDTSVGIRFGTFSRGDWFSLRRIGLFFKNATYNFLRGHN